MSINPYAPPTADVSDIALHKAVIDTPPFFVVSIPKLVILSICTIDLYKIYWFYKNWQLIRLREQSNISPGLRALFSIIFCYACFSRIREFGLKAGIKPNLPAGVLTTGLIIESITWNLPNPYWLLGFLGIGFLAFVQAYANRINTAVSPNHTPNRRLTKWNWLVVALGGSLVIFAVIGAFMPA